MKLSHDEIAQRMDKCTAAIMEAFPDTPFLLTVDLNEQVIIGSNDNRALHGTVDHLVNQMQAPPSDNLH